MDTQTNPDLPSFVARVNKLHIADPARAALAGRNLIDGALRIRRGGDGLYKEAPRPITKPAEAIGAWISSIEHQPNRDAEMREALIAAAEEVNAAADAAPAAARLRGALYKDALDVVGEGSTSPWRHPLVPWFIASFLGGLVAGLLLTAKRK